MVVTVSSQWRSISCPRKGLLMSGFIFLFGLLLILQMSPKDYISAEMMFKHEKCDQRNMNKTATSWPKIIHQIWIGKSVPEKYKDFQESCRVLNPDYKFMVWNGDELAKLITDHYPWFVETLASYPYMIQRVDVGKLFLLYHFGGTYLDLDIKCTVPLKTITENAIQANPNTHIILGETQPIGVTNNVMICRHKTAFMDFVIHRLLETKGRHFTEYWTIMFSTGPLFVYRTYMTYPCKDQVHILSEHNHSHVYFTHGRTGSWHSWEGPFIRFFDNHGRVVLQVTTFIAAIILIQRSYKFLNSKGN